MSDTAGKNDAALLAYTYVSHEHFLLSELRYTLGQLQMQLKNFVSEGLERDIHQDVNPLVSAMLAYEAEYRYLYENLLNISSSSDQPHIDTVPRLEDERKRTIELLETTSLPWNEALLTAVQRHVADDRYHITRIADIRIRETGESAELPGRLS